MFSISIQSSTHGNAPLPAPSVLLPRANHKDVDPRVTASRSLGSTGITGAKVRLEHRSQMFIETGPSSGPEILLNSGPAVGNSSPGKAGRSPPGRGTLHSSP